MQPIFLLLPKSFSSLAELKRDKQVFSPAKEIYEYLVLIFHEKIS